MNNLEILRLGGEIFKVESVLGPPPFQSKPVETVKRLSEDPESEKKEAKLEEKQRVRKLFSYSPRRDEVGIKLASPKPVKDDKEGRYHKEKEESEMENPFIKEEINSIASSGEKKEEKKTLHK